MEIKKDSSAGTREEGKPYLNILMEAKVSPGQQQ